MQRRSDTAKKPRGGWANKLLNLVAPAHATSKAAQQDRVFVVRGKYDAAQTTHENRRHWLQADHLSANAAISAEVRRTLRSRARYEVANNSYASGRLDHQAFFKAIRIDQAYLGDMVLDRVLRASINEAVLIEGYLPQSVRTLSAKFPHQWFWDGFEHVDPAKEANAQATRLRALCWLQGCGFC